MDKIIEKIQKLLALGQSDNEHEASLAMKRANELKYRSAAALDEGHVPDRRGQVGQLRYPGGKLHRQRPKNETEMYCDAGSRIGQAI